MTPEQIAAKPSCASCAFHLPNERPEYAGAGYCRRFPPQISVWAGTGGYGEPQGNFEQHFPWMQPDQWCGEFRKIIEGEGNA